MDGAMNSAAVADRYEMWLQAALADQAIERVDAASILDGSGIDLMSLLTAAGAVRRRFFGDSVAIHILDNVRNGACPEDCGYCGQSSDSDAAVQPYKLKSVDQIVQQAAEAQRSGAYRFCMALSGRGPSDRDVQHISQAIRRIKAMGMRTCLSTGIMDDDKARQLAEAGLDRLNHNLNTSRRHYPEICTTHTYDDRLATMRSARQAGIGICSGMIVGMNETHQDILDVAYALRDMRTESIPVNFLLPIEGNRIHTPLSAGAPLNPQYVLRVLCMMRLVNPTAEIRIAAGREHHLRSLQPLSLWPANSLFMAGYLLTEGQGPEGTLRMILDAGFKPVFEHPETIPQALREIAEGRTDETAPGMTPLTVLKSTVARK